MTNLLLFIIIVILLYNNYQKDKKKEKGKKSFSHLSSSMQGKLCEISLTKPLFNIDILYVITGVIQDFDEDWVIVETTKNKKVMTKIFRVSLIIDIKEIKQ